MIYQVQVEECGAACLTMILNHYGKKISITEVRKFFDIGRNGVSALDIVKSGRACGFEIKAFWLTDIKKLQEIQLPAIGHWNFNHFVVIEEAGSDKIIIVDPAYGRKEMSYEEFEANFGGTIITLADTGNLLPSWKKPPPFWINYLKSFLTSRSETSRPYGQFLILSVILAVLGVLPFYFIKETIDSFNNAGISIYSLTGLGLILTYLFFIVFGYLRLLTLNKLKQEFNKHLAKNFFKRLWNLSFAGIQRMHGDILHRVGNVNYVQSIFIPRISQILSDALNLILFFVILFIFAFPSAVFIIAVNTFIFLTILYVTKEIELIKRTELRSKVEEQHHLTESLKGVYYIKAIGAEDEVLSYWESLFQNSMDVSKSADTLNAKLDAFLNATKFIYPVLLLWFNFIYGNISLGTNLAIVGLATTIFPSVSDIAVNINRFITAQMHFVRLREILEIDLPETQPGLINHKIKGEIECRSLNFSYSKSNNYVLENINFNIEPSQKIVFLGDSSSGKTTIVNLLLGLYEIKEGDILYDKVSIKEIDLGNLRNQIGLVPQESFIFDGSILDNLCFGNKISSPEDIIKAAQLAEIHEEIMQMPLGYETAIGNQAFSISAGQKQRLSLARALLRHPAVLIFDECFNNLDLDTIKKIDKNLSSLECTRIFVTTNSELVENADFIYVYENGKIVNSGTNDDLFGEDKLNGLKLSSGDLLESQN